MRSILISIVLLALSSCDVVFADIGTITLIDPQPYTYTITTSTVPGVTIAAGGSETITIAVPGPQGIQGATGPQGPQGIQGEPNYPVSDISTAKQYRLVINGGVLGMEEL